MESPRVSLDGFRHHLQASSSWLRPSSGHDSISVAVIYIGSALAKTASKLHTTSTSPGFIGLEVFRVFPIHVYNMSGNGTTDLIEWEKVPA